MHQSRVDIRSGVAASTDSSSDLYGLTVAQLPIMRLAAFLGTSEGAEEGGAAKKDYFTLGTSKMEKYC